MSKLIRNPYNWFLLTLGLLSLLPILAPLFMKLSESVPLLVGPARLIYLIYSFTCHQFASRSIHLFDYQFAWCARDTGIWLGIFTAAVLVRVLKLKGISLYWLIPFIIPVAMDGGIQTITTALNISPVGVSGEALYISTNLIRFISGTILGMGVGLWVASFVIVDFVPDYRTAMDHGKLRGGWEQVRIIIAAVAALFCLYVALVALWDLTSVKNKPSDWLDSAVKTPAVDFYARRQDGACPTTGADILSFKCD